MELAKMIYDESTEDSMEFVCDGLTYTVWMAGPLLVDAVYVHEHDDSFDEGEIQELNIELENMRSDENE